jgi:hypothetical protein
MCTLQVCNGVFQGFYALYAALQRLEDVLFVSHHFMQMDQLWMSQQLCSQVDLAAKKQTTYRD